MKNKLYRYILISLSLTCAIFLTGCWDYMEIERRGYILGIAIDLVEDKDVQDKMQYMQTEVGVPTHLYTIQLPILPNSSIKPSGQGAGGGQDDKTWNLKIAGNSFFEVNREYATILDYPAFYEHLKSIVISEEAARKGIYDFTDFFMRDPEMRRRTRVFITPGKAHKILEVDPKIEDYPSMSLRSLPSNANRNSRMLHKTDLGRVITHLHSGNDFVLPKVIASKTEIKNAGAAVFKKDKMVGWIDEIQTNYLKWISGYAEGGTITIESPDNPSKQVCLEMKNLKTDVKPVVHGEEITFNINVKANFNIVEVNHGHHKRVFEEEFIKEVKRIAEKKAEKQMRETIEFVQKEYGTDIFFFYQVMQRYAPDTWDKVEKDWDSIFPKVKTNINVNIKIDQIGLIK